MKNKLYLFIFFLLPMASFGQAGVWTWVNGDSSVNSPGHYGVLGVPDSMNTPPAFYEPCEWTDLQGNFWLFGGLDVGYNVWGDLWEYDVATNDWTWVNGSGQPKDSGSYGIMDEPDTGNRPPSRAWGAATWVDLNGDLWLYGGGGRRKIYNDLWKYNIASNEWMWVNGSSTAVTAASYGAKGIPSANNSPGWRWECVATWVDANNDLWLFGGFNGTSFFNDLWRYNITSNEWTWMSGADYQNEEGMYGTRGVFDSTNVPGARQAYCSWKDENGRFWFFGGSVYADWNDMWEYDAGINQWAWISGADVNSDGGSYGALCSSSTNFSPSARFETRARWKDGCGNFWLYGGGKGDAFSNVYSDLWCFNPSTLKWTLAYGDSTSNHVPVYNVRGMASGTSSPGGRAGCVAWRSTSGTLYLFGGCVGTWLKPYNDLWKYTIDSSCVGSCNDISTGIENAIAKNPITIYPNPATDKINIALSQLCNGCVVVITDMFGREVIQQALNGEVSSIGLDNISAGIYIVRVTTSKEMVTSKVVKQ